MVQPSYCLLGAVEMQSQIIPEAYRGITLIAIAGITTVLRFLTTQPVSDKRLASFRFITGFLALPLFADTIPRGYFAAFSGFVTAAALLARVIAQPEKSSADA
jgi:hypothetical protein